MKRVTQASWVIRRRAFSLVELLITIGIIAIVCSLAFPSLTRARERARKVKCEGVLQQVYLATTLYADDHEGQMPSWSLFFEEAMAPPRCPSATARLSNIGNGGYAWGPVLDSTRKFNEVPPNAWLASDRIPWHDPKRAGRNDGFWEGRVNSLRVDGHIEWIRLLTPP